MDNNHYKYVMVFLGDLGHLKHKEQLYWKSFNVSTTDKMSYTAWKRGFEAQFTDPEKVDLYFKQKYETFNNAWKEKFDWHFFLPLSKEDEHHFKSLRIPLINDQLEFDQQILSLTKIFIDSLNEKELKKGFTIEKENPKGIDKLEAFLNANGKRFFGMIKYLRNLQDLRSTGVAHLKGQKYHKIKQEFEIDKKELPEVFENILTKAIWTLNSLKKHFFN